MNPALIWVKHRRTRRNQRHPQHLQHQRILGPDRFRLAIERKLRRKVGPKNVGRPKKPSSQPATC